MSSTRIFRNNVMDIQLGNSKANKSESALLYSGTRI